MKKSAEVDQDVMTRQHKQKLEKEEQQQVSELKQAAKKLRHDQVRFILSYRCNLSIALKIHKFETNVFTFVSGWMTVVTE